MNSTTRKQHRGRLPSTEKRKCRHVHQNASKISSVTAYHSYRQFFAIHGSFFVVMDGQSSQRLTPIDVSEVTIGLFGCRIPVVARHWARFDLQVAASLQWQSTGPGSTYQQPIMFFLSIFPGAVNSTIVTILLF